MRIRVLLLLSVALGTSGCFVYRAGRGLDEVRMKSQERLRPELVSHIGKESDTDLEGTLQNLLADDLTGDKAVRIALLNNQELKARYEQLGLSQAELVGASLPANPVFTIERRFSGKAFEFDVAQSFLSLLLLPLQTRMAGAQFEAAKLELTQQVVEHALETRQAFYTLQAKSQLIGLRKAAALAAEAAADVANRLRTAGNITELELREHQSAMAEARLELAHTEAEVVQSREKLNVLMGLWGKNTSWKIQPELPALPDDDGLKQNLESVAVGTRADLLAINEQLRSRADALGLARIESFLPELSIGSHFEREPEGDESTGPSIDIAFPVFDFGQARRGAATALLNQARMLYGALAIKIRSEVRSAYGQMKIARARAEHYENSLIPTQGKKLRQTQLQYNAMQIGPFELIQAKQEQVKALEGKTEALEEYWLSRTELEKALGRELPLSSPVAGPVPAASHEHMHH
jgi:outer membrane protein, heavy metal efflux system